MFTDIIASSGQKKGGCGHIMANFDTHIHCARCREKGAGSDPCVQGKEDCAACLLYLKRVDHSSFKSVSSFLKEESSSEMLVEEVAEAVDWFRSTGPTTLTEGQFHNLICHFKFWNIIHFIKT